MLPLNNSINVGAYNNNLTPSKMTSSKAGIIQNGLNSLHGINNITSSINNSKTPKEQYKRMQMANSNNQGNHSNRVHLSNHG